MSIRIDKTFPFAKLPLDCQLNISTYCLDTVNPARRMGQLSRVCRAWNTMIKSREVYTQLVNQPSIVTGGILKAVTKAGGANKDMLTLRWNQFCLAKFTFILNNLSIVEKTKDLFGQDIALNKFLNWTKSLSKIEIEKVTEFDFSEISRDFNFDAHLSIIKALPNLASLKLRVCQTAKKYWSEINCFSPDQIRLILSSCPRLTALKVRFQMFTRGFYSHLIPFATQIRSLEMEHWFSRSDDQIDFIEFITQTLSLTHLRLPHIYLQNWLPLCLSRNIHLQSLQLEDGRFSNIVCTAIATHCTGLRILHMNIQPPMTNEGIITILMGCRQLTQLKLSDFSHLHHTIGIQPSLINKEVLTALITHATSLKEFIVNFRSTIIEYDDLKPFPFAKEDLSSLQIERPTITIISNL